MGAGGGPPAVPPSVPAIVLDHVGQLDDELPLLVLLAQLERLLLGRDGGGR